MLDPAIEQALLETVELVIGLFVIVQFASWVEQKTALIWGSSHIAPCFIMHWHEGTLEDHHGIFLSPIRCLEQLRLPLFFLEKLAIVALLLWQNCLGLVIHVGRVVTDNWRNGLLLRIRVTPLADSTVFGKDGFFIQAVVIPDLINVLQHFWLRFSAWVNWFSYRWHLGH